MTNKYDGRQCKYGHGTLRYKSKNTLLKAVEYLDEE